MVTITITEGRGYIAGVPPQIEDDLIRECSFRPVGVEHTWRYQRQKDKKDPMVGRVKLLKNSKFPPGLLTRITHFLAAHDVPFSVVNQDYARTKPQFDMRTVGVQPRPYQDEAVEACVLRRRGIIQAPTGSGKTAIGARLVAAKRGSALIVVPTIDLLYQYKRFLTEHLIGDAPLWEIGQLGDGVVDPQLVTVATVRTAAKLVGIAYESYEFGEYDDRDDTEIKRAELREWVEGIATVIVDEAHILGAETVYQLCTRIPAVNFFGMSASPWRDDGADLMIEGATGDLAYDIGTKTLVDGGWLVPPIIQVVSTRGWWTSGAWGKICKRCQRQTVTWAKECERCHGTEFKSQFTDCYRVEIVENAVRNAGIAELVYGLDVPTLVLVKQVKHGRLLASMMRDSVFLSGRDSSDVRNKAFEGVRSGEIRVLVATTIADMGLDLPALGALVLAGGGKSSTRHLQRIGRIARPFDGKKAARVIDFDDTHVHQWFANHAKARRKIEMAAWGEVALWI